MPAKNPTILQEPKSTSSKAAAKKASRPTWMDENLTEPPTWYNTSGAASPSSAHPAVEEEDFEEVAEEEPWDSSAPAVEEEDLEEVKPWDEETYPWRGKAGSARQAWAAQRSGWRKKRGGKQVNYFSAKKYVQHSEFHSWYSRPENRS